MSKKKPSLIDIFKQQIEDSDMSYDEKEDTVDEGVDVDNRIKYQKEENKEEGSKP